MFDNVTDVQMGQHSTCENTCASDIAKIGEN